MSKAKRWKPKKREGYWMIENNAHVQDYEWFDDSFDNSLYHLGNCFQTEKEAKAVARKLKAFWKDIREGKL